MSLSGRQFKKTAGVAQVAHDGRERLDAIPGIEVSAFTCCLPLESVHGLAFNIIGRAPEGKSPWNGGAGWMSASPGYFSVFHIPILRGRHFTEQDTGSAPGVVLINETMGKELWPKGDAVGQQLLIGKGVGPQFTEPARQIIGVVGDIRDLRLNNDPRPLTIVPSAQVTYGITAIFSNIDPLVWLVRTHGDPHKYISAITEQLRQASGGFPVADVRPTGPGPQY
jgi:putative ABC transport system permease protein